MSTEQLAQQQALGEDLLLLDAREPDEYAVSRLAGAHPVPDAAAALRLLADAKADRRIVVYCSVGYRSAAMARQLTDAGFTNVWNLQGSIFQWANEGRPVFKGDRAGEEGAPL